MSPFELVDHTADVGLNITGYTIDEFFNDAARGMFHIIVGDGVEGWDAKHIIELEAPDIECLLVDWLSELLYLFDIKKFIFRGAEFEMLTDVRLRCTARGISFKGSISGTEIKAVTHHMLEVSRTLDGFEASVVFDL